MTIQNKIYEGMAMGKPVITGASPGVADLMESGVMVLTSDRGDPASLAQTLKNLVADRSLRLTLSEQISRAYYQRFTISQIGRVFKVHLLDVLRDRDAG
jgi:glycosyltransferase involved in cell wall biosynthesis